MEFVAGLVHDQRDFARLDARKLESTEIIGLRVAAHAGRLQSSASSVYVGADNRSDVISMFCTASPTTVMRRAMSPFALMKYSPGGRPSTSYRPGSAL